MITHTYVKFSVTQDKKWIMYQLVKPPERPDKVNTLITTIIHTTTSTYYNFPNCTCNANKYFRLASRFLGSGTLRKPTVYSGSESEDTDQQQGVKNKPRNNSTRAQVRKGEFHI